MKYEYRAVSDEFASRREFERHRATVRELESLGFRPLCVVEELSRSPLTFAALPLMWARHEPAGITPRLRVRLRSPLMVNADGTVTALLFAMGVKFYSELSDGSVVITGNFKSFVLGEWPDRGLYKYGDRSKAIDATYEEHQAHVRSLIAGDPTERRDLDFAAYVRMSDRETGQAHRPERGDLEREAR